MLFSWYGAEAVREILVNLDLKKNKKKRLLPEIKSKVTEEK